MGERLLVVEDDRTLQEALAYALERQGYCVSTADDGYQALELARAQQPDLVVLDVMLPGIDGFGVCRTLRRDSHVPIVMLTARTDELDRVVGLESGADDYITKPFSMRELIARVRAQLRRVRLVREETRAALPKPGAEVVEAGDLTVNVGRRQAVWKGNTLPLKPRELELLLYLVRNQGLTVSRAAILETLWGWDYDGGSRTIDVHVRWLREKLEPDPNNPVHIITVRGVGYRFEV